MEKILISKKAAKRIENIFTHPNGIFSIYWKDREDVDWVQGKIELYNRIHEIETT